MALERHHRLERRLRIVTVVLIVVLAYLIGFITGSKAAADVAAERFVDQVRADFALTEVSSLDVLSYGLATCAGFDDGWSHGQVVSWLSNTPYDYLGVAGDRAEFGRAASALAVQALCPEAGR